MVLACTSGTAAANYAPAVIEAHHARVPLIVLTADRPPELRDNGAGQAIDQLKLYGDAVRWFVEVGVEEATPANLRWIRELACRAYPTRRAPCPARCTSTSRCASRWCPTARWPPTRFRAGPAAGRGCATTRGHRAGARPARRCPPGASIVAGRDERDPGSARRSPRSRSALGYPLLADPLSGARRGPAAIATYDLLLRDPAFTRRARTRTGPPHR